MKWICLVGGVGLGFFGTLVAGCGASKSLAAGMPVRSSACFSVSSANRRTSVLHNQPPVHRLLVGAVRSESDGSVGVRRRGEKITPRLSARTHVDIATTVRKEFLTVLMPTFSTPQWMSGALSTRQLAVTTDLIERLMETCDSLLRDHPAWIVDSMASCLIEMLDNEALIKFHAVFNTHTGATVGPMAILRDHIGVYLAGKAVPEGLETILYNDLMHSPISGKVIQKKHFLRNDPKNGGHLPLSDDAQRFMAVFILECLDKYPLGAVCEQTGEFFVNNLIEQQSLIGITFRLLEEVQKTVRSEAPEKTALDERLRDVYVFNADILRRVVPRLVKRRVSWHSPMEPFDDGGAGAGADAAAQEVHQQSV